MTTVAMNLAGKTLEAEDEILDCLNRNGIFCFGRDVYREPCTFKR
jgi:hypothetical protein